MFLSSPHHNLIMLVVLLLFALQNSQISAEHKNSERYLHDLKDDSALLGLFLINVANAAG